LVRKSFSRIFGSGSSSSIDGPPLPCRREAWRRRRGGGASTGGYEEGERKRISTKKGAAAKKRRGSGSRQIRGRRRRRGEKVDLGEEGGGVEEGERKRISTKKKGAAAAVAMLRLNIATLRRTKKGANRAALLSSVDGSSGGNGAWPHSP
jgi:hypothetical protein